jgi:dynein heavy chain 2
VGLLENAIYGGRIDNEIDMRLLRTYLDQFFCRDLFDGKKPVFGSVTATQASKADKALQLFDSLPDKDTPATFGLLATADVSVQKMNVADIVANLKKIKSGAIGSAKFDTELWTNGLANIIKVWKTVYKQLSDSGIPKVRDEDLLVEDPIAALIFTEIRTSLTNVRRMAEKFKKLLGVLKGEIPLEKDIETFGAALLVSKVPIEWENIMEDQASPSQWLTNYFKKLILMKSWKDLIDNGTILENDLSLSEIFNPDVFLNAYKLFSAQKQKTSVDDLVLCTTFDKSQIQSKDKPLKVRSLLLQGCSFNNKMLDEKENSNSSAEYEILPVCYMNFIPKAQLKADSESITVPLFINLTREKLIAEVSLQYTGSKSGLIIKSVALAITP